MSVQNNPEQQSSVDASAPSSAPRLKAFSAQISVRSSSGYSTTVGYGGKLQNPHAAVLGALLEILLIAEAFGLRDDAQEVIGRVFDGAASRPRAESPETGSEQTAAPEVKR